MPRVNSVLSRAARAAGEYLSSEVAVPVGTTRVTLRVPRNSWPAAANVLQLSVELWDGVTWTSRGGCGTSGGDIVGRAGIEPETWLQVWFPDPSNVQRRARIRVTCATALDIGVDVDLDAVPLPPTSRLTTNSVGFDTGDGATAGAATSVTTAAFTPAGSDRLLLGFGFNGGAPQAYSNLSTSTDGTLTSVQNNTFNTFFRGVAGHRIAPTASSTTLTYTIAVADVYMSCGAMTFTGAHQTTPLDTWDFGSGTSNNPSRAISSASDEMVAQCLWGDNVAIAVSGDGTSRFEDENFGADGFSQGMSTAPGSATVNLGWSFTAGPYGWGVYSVNINQSAGPPWAQLNRTYGPDQGRVYTGLRM